MDNHSPVKTYGGAGQVLEGRRESGGWRVDIAFEAPCGSTLFYNAIVGETHPQILSNLCESCARERGFIW